MSFLKKLFGGGSGGGASKEPDAIDHEGFRIIPTPINEGGKYRLSARIEMGEGEALKSHTLIRADVLNDFDQAAEASIAKAKQMIKEQGERLFG